MPILLSLFFSSFLQFNFAVCVHWRSAICNCFAAEIYSQCVWYGRTVRTHLRRTKTETNKKRYAKVLYANRPSSRSDTKLKLYSFRFTRLIILMRDADAVNAVDTATTTAAAVVVITTSSDYFRLSLSLYVHVFLIVSSFCSQSRNYVSTSCIP